MYIHIYHLSKNTDLFKNTQISRHYSKNVSDKNYRGYMIKKDI